MANTVKPSMDDIFKRLELLNSPGAQIIKAINNVINSTLGVVEGEDRLDQISKVCLLL